MELYLNGKKIRLKPSQAIGKGGEADIYDLGQGQALKLFKQPDHPDYKLSVEQQQAAKERLAEHQSKLRLFPRSLPSRVIRPQEFVTDAAGHKIFGYTMQRVQDATVLMKYSDRNFRQSGISHQTVVEIFRDLHTTVSRIHKTGTLIGDFNDLNILVKDTEAYLIDADSFQFSTFPCRVFTARFVDPLLCDPQATKPVLFHPYTLFSDWYAFTTILMQCLLFVNPYGGIYRPQDPANRIPHDARPLHRITVFHPEVQYPKPALSYKVLPDELLHYFCQVFEQDKRGEFPRQLLEHLQWTKCLTCGKEHARNHCPDCRPGQFPVQTLTQIVRGTVTATRIFFTEGIILFTTLQGEKLRWIYHENGEFKREDTSTILSGSLDPQLKFRIQGKSTLLGKQSQVITLTPGQNPGRLAAETFDANRFSRYWIASGQLLRDGVLGPEYIGDVLAGQTQFWIGESFGFGFYVAGNLNVAFVFDVHRKGICDWVKLPPISGQCIDSTCTFSQQYAWFLWATEEQGKTFNQCAVIQPNGEVVATRKTEANDGSWLGTIHGKCAAENFLLAATDDGIVRVEVQQHQLVKTKEFPDTESFVDSSCHLFATQEGLYSVKQQEIMFLKIH